jgi:endonuclease-3
MAVSDDVAEIDARLRDVFGTSRWEPDLDPLSELIQTILSQHTTGPNSRRAFEQLRERFPTWDDLRTAQVDDVASAIHSAGLARLKAPRIRQIVERVQAERGDYDLSFLAELPVTDAMAWLRRLPGVGQTTAACCLLFGLGRPAMPVDAGIQRIAGRLGLVPSGAAAEAVQATLEAAVPARDVYALHINLIRFGREICRPSQPLCAVCPLNDLCDYFGQRRRPTTAPAGAPPRLR